MEITETIVEIENLLKTAENILKNKNGWSTYQVTATKIIGIINTARTLLIKTDFQKKNKEAQEIQQILQVVCTTMQQLKRKEFNPYHNPPENIGKDIKKLIKDAKKKLGRLLKS